MSDKTVLLVHGGLYDPMDAQHFWVDTGVVAALETHGVRVLAPDRLNEPESWQSEAAHLAEALGFAVDEPVSVVAGSDGCSAALRLALDFPAQVRDLVLCWPVTVRDDEFSSPLWAHIVRETGLAAASSLLSGETVRGVTNVELRSLKIRVSVMAAVPMNPVHQLKTVAELLRLIPDCRSVPGFPETPSQAFPSRCEEFVDVILG